MIFEIFFKTIFLNDQLLKIISNIYYKITIYVFTIKLCLLLFMNPEFWNSSNWQLCVYIYFIFNGINGVILFFILLPSILHSERRYFVILINHY